MPPIPKPSPHAPFTALATPKDALKSPSSSNSSRSVSYASATQDKSLSFLALYRFATPADKLQLVLGAVLAGVNGAIFPCMALVLGTAINAFAQADGGVDRDAVNRAALYYFLIAVALFATDCLAYILFCNSAERQMKALRGHVFAHMLYMDVSWYDRSDAFELSSRITGDTVKIKDGMGQKLSDSIKFTCQFFVGYVIGFARGWDMSLVMACVMPFMVLSLKYMVRLFRKRAVLSQKMYAEAGAVAEETLGSIRTVASLNGEKRAIDKYNERAVLVETGNIAISKRSACVFGCMMGSIWLMYAAGLWYGGSKVARAEASPGTVFQAFFGVLMGRFLSRRSRRTLRPLLKPKVLRLQFTRYLTLHLPSTPLKRRLETSRSPALDAFKPSASTSRIQVAPMCRSSTTTTSPSSLAKLSPLSAPVEEVRAHSSRYSNGSTTPAAAPFCSTDVTSRR
uniref:ABC transmembrane type-1 domain-containing protein n=1 Tax=Phytophthora fragariae TaxID=53985 RepID=A0A6A3DSP2_9STRA|nr:hypothetical protein PF009_g26599 [Phytophthora fragariae]